ncbi:hypothetical protein F444_14021 [Phytophthora nicotianae P1976]|uniref:Uncharacterized protein n=1 Tax=Phytophthora nicotianae P1976 TaxID=1317066 RepID=A0A080ZRX5_PHYNI|nr:hypothetical protein F444_14021 [Phytophthora nicotianae P1976]
MEQRSSVRAIQNRSGGRVNFLSDVWETIAKLHTLGRVRRILAPCFANIAFTRCFAHDVNHLVKAILNSAFKNISKEAAGVEKFLNASTSK